MLEISYRYCVIQSSWEIYLTHSGVAVHPLKGLLIFHTNVRNPLQILSVIQSSWEIYPTHSGVAVRPLNSSESVCSLIISAKVVSENKDAYLH